MDRSDHGPPLVIISLALGAGTMRPSDSSVMARLADGPQPIGGHPAGARQGNIQGRDAEPPSWALASGARQGNIQGRDAEPPSWALASACPCEMADRMKSGWKHM